MVHPEKYIYVSLIGAKIGYVSIKKLYFNCHRNMLALLPKQCVCTGERHDVSAPVLYISFSL